MAARRPLNTRNVFIGFSSQDGARPPGWKLYDTDLIKRDIMNEFMTPLGSRVMLPNFGSKIWDYVFEPFTVENREAIAADVERVISHEPRVRLIYKIVEEDVDNHAIKISVQLEYVPFSIIDTLFVSFTNSIGTTS